MLFGIDVDKATLIERMSTMIVRSVPFNGALGLKLEDIEEGAAVVRLPYRAELVGNPETGALHGGMVTSLIDATCGVSVFARLQRPTRIATLDLRIDYLRPATAPLDVLARAECVRTTRDVAFVRAVAHHGDPGDAIATAAGTFVIFDDGRSPLGRALAEQRRG